MQPARWSRSIIRRVAQYLTVGNPIKLSDSPADVRRSPLLGEHTQEILRKVLGYSDKEVAEIKSSGAITAPEQAG